MTESAAPTATTDAPDSRRSRRSGDGWRRIYASSEAEARVRRATDVLLLLSALGRLAVLIAAYPPGSFERSLVSFLEAFPGWLDRTRKRHGSDRGHGAGGLSLDGLSPRRVETPASGADAALAGTLCGELTTPHAGAEAEPA
jgi:hypothetical protein